VNYFDAETGKRLKFLEINLHALHRGIHVKDDSHPHGEERN
jgi:hypothetical protein